MTGSPEYVAAWERFDAAVAECRRLEAKHKLPIWASYIEGHDVKTIPNEELPCEYVAAVAEWNAAYVAAVAEWNAARLARNAINARLAEGKDA